MKEGWTYKKLGEVCKLYQPKTISTKEMIPDGKYNVFGANGIIGKYNQYNHEFSEILMTCRGATCGNINLSTPKSWINGNAMVIHIQDENILIRDFLVYELSFVDKKHIITGAAQPQITRQTLYPLTILFPPLSEQRSIVSRLDAAFAEIDALKANAEMQLNEARALFQKALEEEMTPKEGWEEKTINDVAKYRSGIAHEKVICDDGCYVVVNSKFVSTDGRTKKYSNKQLAPLYKNDIVMVLSDVPKGKTLAKCYIIEQDNLYTLNQRVCAFESKGIITRFLYYMLNRNPHLLGYDNGENQTNLRVKNVTDCPVYYPNDKDTQKAIVARLDALSANIKQLEELQRKTLAECDALKQAMLREIFE